MCARKSICQRCLHILKGHASLQLFNLLFCTTRCGPWTLLSQEVPSLPPRTPCPEFTSPEYPGVSGVRAQEPDNAGLGMVPLVSLGGALAPLGLSLVYLFPVVPGSSPHACTPSSATEDLPPPALRTYSSLGCSGLLYLNRIHRVSSLPCPRPALCFLIAFIPS